MANVFAKGLKYMTDPHYRFGIDTARGKYDDVPDEEFIKRKWNEFYTRNGGGGSRIKS